MIFYFYKYERNILDGFREIICFQKMEDLIINFNIVWFKKYLLLEFNDRNFYLEYYK